MSTNNLLFEQKYEKYQNFLSEIFHFLVLKFSVYLNRYVFVMHHSWTVRTVTFVHNIYNLFIVYNSQWFCKSTKAMITLHKCDWSLHCLHIWEEPFSDVTAHIFTHSRWHRKWTHEFKKAQSIIHCEWRQFTHMYEKPTTDAKICNNSSF